MHRFTNLSNLTSLAMSVRQIKWHYSYTKNKVLKSFCKKKIFFVFNVCHIKKSKKDYKVNKVLFKFTFHV